MGTPLNLLFAKMKYIAAYLLASLNKQNPSAADVTKVLSAVGANVDDAQLSAVMGALDGQNVDALIEAGAEKFASVPSGGGAAPAAAGGDAGASGGAAAADASGDDDDESSSGGMDFGLFD